MTTTRQPIFKNPLPTSPRMRRVWPIVAIVCLLAPLTIDPVQAVTTQSAEYNVPSSFVVRGVFGFGVLLCAEPEAPDLLVETVQNGPCFDYAGHEGDVFFVDAKEDLWARTAVTVAVDINGDGCISDSCSGVPNNADYRVSNCGQVSGILPETDPGVEPIIQVFLRAIDVTHDLDICGATQGTVSLTMQPASF